MTDRWVKTQTTEDARTSAKVFWDRQRAALDNGQFWADEIKKMRGQPARRLQTAIDNLPLPAAFREATVAIRALIREKRKQKASYEDEVALLYWLAAVESFSLPYSEVMREPGFNILQSIPAKTIKSLAFTYQELGYKKLSLLNKTDVKWITELWGEPNAHTTLNQLHSSVWKAAEERLRVQRQKERNHFEDKIRRLLK